jgi:hypothetical protein
MSLLFKNRWGFGLGAAATTAAVILIMALAAPKVQAKAADVLAKGAPGRGQAHQHPPARPTAHAPGDNFSYIDANSAFYPIELWKQLVPEPKWRIEKPGRVALMDGLQTVMYIKPAKDCQ